MARILNKYKDEIPEDAVYIGRPSQWGNPYSIGLGFDRDGVVDAFEKWVRSQPFLIAKIQRQLRGKDLVCFCAPLRCHGDILLKIANS